MRLRDLTENTDQATDKSGDFAGAIADFTEAVKQHLTKRAERAYRQSGEEWDPRINELEAQYLDSLEIENLRNWIRYSYELHNRRKPLFFVLKSDTTEHKSGDVFIPNSQNRPDLGMKMANIFDEVSVEGIARFFD